MARELPPFEITGNPGQVYRDWIPASEEHLYPGQGTGGQGMDYVPAGETAAKMIKRQAAQQELDEYAANQGAKAVVSATARVEGRVDSKPAKKAAAGKIRRPYKRAKAAAPATGEVPDSV